MDGWGRQSEAEPNMIEMMIDNIIDLIDSFIFWIGFFTYMLGYISYRIYVRYLFVKRVTQIEPKDKVMEIVKLAELKMVKLENELDSVKQKFHSLRGTVNRKVHGIKEDDEDDSSIKTETTKYNDGFDELRKINKNG